MLIGRRCTGCGERYYADHSDPNTECQTCSGSHDPVPQALADAASLDAINSFQMNAPSQQVDPRAAPAEPVKRTKKKAPKDDAPAAE